MRFISVSSDILAIKLPAIAFVMAFVLWASLKTNAQKNEFSLKADKTDALIGEHVILRMKVSVDRKTTLIWPVFADTLTKGLLVLRVGNVDSIKAPDGIIHYNKQITVTAFDSGTFVLDNIRVGYSYDGYSLNGELIPDTIRLKFSLMEIEENANLRDIKDIMKLPFSFQDIIPWFLILAALALIALLVYRFILRIRRKKKINVNERINISETEHHPWEIAIEELESLRSSDILWVTGVKAYYTALSEIIRIYLRDGLGIDAPELTTRETLQRLTGHKSVPVEQRETLSRILYVADMVKFAKFNPSSEENTKVLDDAIDFVIGTAPDHLSPIKEQEDIL